jgi:adenylate cyclase
LGDVVEESDGDLMGDGVNIAARLEGVAKPGAICLSEDAYRQVKSRLDLAVSDLGSTQLKNIAEPMRVYSLQVGVPTPAKPTKPSSKQRSPLVPVLAAIVALIVIAGSGWYYFNAKRIASNAPTAGNAAHLSIVVLPFANLSGDASQDYFADGITENLTTDLSRIRNTFVIARNTAFSFKGKNVDAKMISKELGVRYVLEGSVQRDQNQVRVNAQLIDGETGAHLWADRFEENVANLFRLQDQVVEGWLIPCDTSWSEQRRRGTLAPKTLTQLISPCVVKPYCGRRLRRKKPMRLTACSKGRSSLMRIAARRWRGTPTRTA